MEVRERQNPVIYFTALQQVKPNSKANLQRSNGSLKGASFANAT